MASSTAALRAQLREKLFLFFYFLFVLFFKYKIIRFYLWLF